MKEPVYVLGGGQTTFGELWEKSLSDLIEEASSAAIENTKILPTDIDAIVVGAMVSGETSEQAHVGTLASSLFSHHPPALRVEAACASGGVAVHTACALLESGRARTVLVIGAEKLTDAPSDIVAKALMNAADSEKDRQSGLTFPGIFALSACAYMEQYGISRDQLSLVSAASHRAAVNNPYAQFRREIDAASVSRSPLVADPLRLLDCSPISDGAAALVLSTRPLSGVRLAASQVATDHLSLTDRLSITSFLSTKTAMDRALEEADWQRSDIDVLELHDCFSIATLIHLEDLGFSEEGRSIALFEQRETESGGALPVNTSGGLKACGHPIGATGIKQILDIWKQLSDCSPNQVPGAKRGLAHNLGGIGATCSLHLLEAD